MPDEQVMHAPANRGRRARALIDTAALRHNLAVVRRLAPGCRVMAVVKSNAYGHGMAAVTHAIAAHVEAFAVATLSEGIECRQQHPMLPITVLSGVHRPESLDVCRHYRLDPVLHAPEHVEWVEKSDSRIDDLAANKLSPWLKIDTGMNRLGFAPAQADAAIARLRRCPAVASIRLMSHLANADDIEDDYSVTQLRRFRQCTAGHVAQTPAITRSMANSAGVMKWPQSHFEWVRPGIMLYGGSPLLNKRGADLGLKPVMRLEARLLAIKQIERGQRVGYGGAYLATAPMRMGVVGFGYADGYPRLVSPAAAVAIGGARAAIIGRVSMDMLTVDLSQAADAAIGCKVVLWGDDPCVDEVAAWAGAIAYELLCKVGGRIERVNCAQSTSISPSEPNNSNNPNNRHGQA